MTDGTPGMWRFVAPAPIEAAHVLWTLGPCSVRTPMTTATWSCTTTTADDGLEPDRHTWHLIWALRHAPEPTLLQLASLFPGYASAVVCAKDEDFDKLREAAGEFISKELNQQRPDREQQDHQPQRQQR